MTALAAAAARYAAQGWAVLPCEPRGKKPHDGLGYEDASADLATVARWWTRWPTANIGTVPGRAALCVLDLDGPEGEATAQAMGLLAEPTLESSTGRGRHRWYRHPGGHIGNRPLGAQLDVRADAGFVLVPPSLHPNGRTYTWHGTLRDVLALPPAVAARLVTSTKPTITRTVTEVTEEALDAALDCLTRLRAERADEYHDWTAVGMALHHATGGHPDALAAWREWSQQSPKFADDRDECGEKWASFGTYRGPVVGLGSLRWWAGLDRLERDTRDALVRLGRAAA